MQNFKDNGVHTGKRGFIALYAILVAISMMHGKKVHFQSNVFFSLYFVNSL